MAKEMKKASGAKILLEKEKIMSAIKEEGEYQEDGLRILKWDGAEDNESYLIELSKSNVKFNGVLNTFLEKDGYGIHHFENGDKYFGFFNDDKRNFNGIYFWPSEYKDGRIKSEMYYGFWKDNNIGNNGIYIWMDESESEQDFDNTNLEAYVGQFVNGTYHKGTYLQKMGDDYFLYHGGFTKDGLKNDENGFFYSAGLDRLFHGKIENDIYVHGYIAFFNSEEGNIENLVYSNFDKDEKITSIILEKNLQKSEKEKESKICSLFRDVILGIDYFGDLYNKVKEISNFVEENMGTLDVFNDEEHYPSIIKLAVAYSRDNINKDINSKVSIK